MSADVPCSAAAAEGVPVTATSCDTARELREALHEAGASLVGFADLSALPADATGGLDSGVAIATALDPRVVAGLARGPTPAYHAEYERVNGVLARLSEIAAGLLRGRGHRVAFAPVTVRASGSDADRTPLPHKTVATRAGLGWIGHSALLVTPEHGAAVRLASVLTDADLPAATPIERSRCGTCRRCVEACPAGAISGRPWATDVPRDRFYDARACRDTASRLARSQGIEVTICGICVAACPWTRRFLKRAGAA